MALIENIYEKLTNEVNARLCDDIPSEACSNAPRGFVLILVSYLFTKLGDAIASPKTTLAWVATAVGAPAFVLGFLVPIRESGSMVPQLFIGGIIRRLPIRKWVWVIGSLGQGLCIGCIGLVVFSSRARPKVGAGPAGLTRHHARRIRGGGRNRQLSNSTIGILLLPVGSVGLLTPIITPAGVIGLLAVMGLAGAWLGRGLPDVE